MQTLFNPRTPFFDSTGNVIAGGQVAFVAVGTDDDYLTIKNYDGTVTYPNPLPLGSDGKFSDYLGQKVTPCVADGVSAEAIVYKPTGVTAIISDGIVTNADELWTQVDRFIVNATKEAASAPTNFVVGINGVRAASKSLGTVVCEGYATKDDGCPSRTFVWVDSANPPSDNYMNILRNPNDATGYWFMNDPECGCWDVRMGGAFPNDGNATAMLQQIQQTILAGKTSVSTVFFPKGDYLLTASISFKSAILDRYCRLKPAGTSSFNFIVSDHFENRGGVFSCADTTSTSSARIIPYVKGMLRTSWLEGTLAEFISDTSLADVDTLIFDSFTSAGGTKNITKAMLVIAFVAIPSNITFKTLSGLDSATILDFYSGIMTTIDMIVAQYLKFNRYVVLNQEYVRVFFNNSLIATLGGTDWVNMDKATIDALTSYEATIGKTSFEQLCAKVTNNTKYIKATASTLNIADPNATEGEILIVENCYAGQVIVTIEVDESYEFFHKTVPLNSNNAAMFVCGWDADTSKKMWKPMWANANITRVDD